MYFKNPPVMKSSLILNMALCLLLPVQIINSQTFDQYFEEGVMRIDLVFSGTADETSYALSGVKKEQFYGGPLSNLIDPFDFW